MIHDSELTVLDKEIFLLSQELNDNKTELLKFAKEQSQWEKEIAFLIVKMDVLNENQLIMEKEREDKEKNKWVEIGHPSTETNT